MADIFPAFLNLSSLLRRGEEQGCAPGASPFRLLEQGAGSAHFLLDAQALHPALELYGLNLEGYRFGGQVGEGLAQLVSSADHFNVGVMCRENKPILPTIKLTVSIAAGDFSYARYLPKGILLDMIVSRDALNYGKLKPSESHVWIPKMLQALKPGGLAVCQTNYLATDVYHDVPGFAKPFSILGVWNMRFGSGTASVLYFQRHTSHNAAGWFGLVSKRCLPQEPATAERGCILEAGYENPFPEDLRLWEHNVSLSAAASHAANSQRIHYAVDYHVNLMRHLRLWQEGGLPEPVAAAE
jgi:hypothetical protein